MRAVLDEVAQRLRTEDEGLIRIPEVCAATGVNYGSVYHHFGSREGVIDAAYEMMFAEMVENDVLAIRSIVETANTIEEFVRGMVPLLRTMSAGDDRRLSRALRVRIVAAAMTRPSLRQMIGATQSRLTDEFVTVVELGQARGWLSREFAPRALAVVLQVVVFGRTLDDVSLTPIGQGEWDVFASQLMSVFLERG